MRFTRKAREQKQKNWRMWKKGKQWLCGAALFFTVVSSPGMTILAAEGNAVETPGLAERQVATNEPPPGEIVEKETEEDSKINENKSPTASSLKQTQESKNSEQATNTESKEAPTKAGKVIPGPTAISSIFPDANLAEVMRTILGKSSVSDMVTQTELNSITSITAENKGIINLSGLENVINLAQLRMNNNNISDLSPLASLSKLKDVYLNNNNISDLTPLNGTVNLTTVSLNNNNISDLSPLMPSELKLFHLYIENNNVSDLSPLGNFTNLQRIDANSNPISDISPLVSLADDRLTNLKIADINMNDSIFDDIKKLPQLNYLVLDNNNISDLSPLADYQPTNGRISMYINNNNISDLSPLENVPVSLYATNQNITLPAEKWLVSLNTTNVVKQLNGDLVAPTSISNGGQYSGSAVKWDGVLNNVNQSVSYSFNKSGYTGGVNTSYIYGFSGTVTLDVIPVGVKVKLDNDGNSSTTGDQTLLAREIGNLNTLEDMYKYAKSQLDGTDYGLIDIQVDNSDGDYVVLVSQVGVLKKVDSDGGPVAADVSYTPTYQVTGTGNAAQLSASYEVTIDAPPSGFVYVYEKGTSQEKRYTTNTPLTIPNTDVNGNGVSDWRDNYTVVQYKKAGNLNPVGPGGTPIPGGVIDTPDESLEGDIITVPDTITGSDGREYTVDPSVDIDPNTPGVQITLDDEDQDVPYLDVVLSESESTSLSESESTSLSESESTSLSESESTSLSESESTSLSESESTSLSESESTSLSESESTSLSESESTSLSESESTSLSESESTSLSESESTSLSESESTSLSESESTSLSES
ncbi:KxYKxGKxW signal peptide domain-containing protein, partial [Listeria monocytogenes]